MNYGQPEFLRNEYSVPMREFIEKHMQRPAPELARLFNVYFANQLNKDVNDRTIAYLKQHIRKYGADHQYHQGTRNNHDLDADIARWWNDGLSASVVADKVNASWAHALRNPMTRSGVIGRIHRMRQRGIALRGKQPTVNKKIGSVPQHRRMDAPRERPKPSDPNFLLATIYPEERHKTPKKMIVQPSHERKKILMGDPVHGVGRPITDLGHNQCRWSVNDAQPGQTHLFCGDKTVPGKSYCVLHQELSVLPPYETRKAKEKKFIQNRLKHMHKGAGNEDSILRPGSW